MGLRAHLNGDYAHSLQKCDAGLESVQPLLKCRTFHQRSPSRGPLRSAVWRQQADGGQPLLCAGRHFDDFLQLGEEVPLVEPAEVYHHVQNEELE